MNGAEVDVAVVGAGPAGASAAIALSGLRVSVFDENAAAGGQVWRAAAPGARSPPTPEARAGAALREALAASGAELRLGARVWQIQPEAGGFRVFTEEACVSARAVLLATGAIERTLPVPGWTVPGVFGVAAATALMKGAGRVPGRRIVVAGQGPLLAYVAASAGPALAAVADANGVADWGARLPALATRPGQALRGAAWVFKIRHRLHLRTGVRAVLGRERVSAVRLGPVGPDGAPVPGRVWEVAADALYLGHGLTPDTAATRLLGCRHVYDPAQGGWHVATDALGRTSVPGVYACGDGAGVMGAGVAPARGRRAAAAIRADLAGAEIRAPGRLRGARFGRAMTTLVPLKPAMLAQITPETVVCRCEGLTRADIEAELGDGAETLSAVKSGTRAGMGPCGGRYCGEVVALLTARATGRPLANVAPPTGRPPLRPVPVAALARGFAYEDLPMPAPAPL